MDTRRQQENGNANAQQLPVFDVLGYFLLARSCIEHFATFGRIQQVNSRSLPRSGGPGSDGQPNEPKCRPLKAASGWKRFLFSFWFDLVWFGKHTTSHMKEALKCPPKTMRRQHTEYVYAVVRATKLATCWGQLSWPSYETPFGSGECTPHSVQLAACSVERCGGGGFRAKIAGSAHEGVICWIHAFSDLPTNRSDGKRQEATETCNIDSQRLMQVPNDVAQWH